MYNQFTCEQSIVSLSDVVLYPWPVSLSQHRSGSAATYRRRCQSLWETFFYKFKYKKTSQCTCSIDYTTIPVHAECWKHFVSSVHFGHYFYLSLFIFYFVSPQQVARFVFNQQAVKQDLSEWFTAFLLLCHPHFLSKFMPQFTVIPHFSCRLPAR